MKSSLYLALQATTVHRVKPVELPINIKMRLENSVYQKIINI